MTFKHGKGGITGFSRQLSRLDPISRLFKGSGGWVQVVYGQVGGFR